MGQSFSSSVDFRYDSENSVFLALGLSARPALCGVNFSSEKVNKQNFKSNSNKFCEHFGLNFVS